MNIETIDLRNIGEADARVSAELVCSIWPKPNRTVDSLAADLQTRWRDYNGLESQYPRSFMIRDEGRLLAHATIIPRTVGSSAGDLTVMGLARVCTAPEARGRGLGEIIARKALSFVDDGTFPFALFQTNDAVRPFYERLGAVQVDNHFVNFTGNMADNAAFWDTVVMRYPAGPGWPVGEINLRGPGW